MFVEWNIAVVLKAWSVLPSGGPWCQNYFSSNTKTFAFSLCALVGKTDASAGVKAAAPNCPSGRHILNHTVAVKINTNKTFSRCQFHWSMPWWSRRKWPTGSMQAALLLHDKVQWFSQGKAPGGLLASTVELGVFYACVWQTSSQKWMKWAYHFQENWQCLLQNDKIWAFKGKLELWKTYICEHEPDSFPIVKAFSNEIGGDKKECHHWYTAFIHHL